MNVWEQYESRTAGIGHSKRDMWVDHTKESIRRRLLDSPGSHYVLMAGHEQVISITHTQDMATKRICALPDENLVHGGIVDYANTKWLITEVDADAEIYERGLMTRCNHVLRWINSDGEIREKWCIVEDGTKYLVGEKTVQMMTIGDARIAVTIGRDEDTVQLKHGMRFLIDDPDTGDVMAYKISKPNRLFNVYDEGGVFRFILTESMLEDGDNLSLRIANYSDWEPKGTDVLDHQDDDRAVEDIVSVKREYEAVESHRSKEVWI